MKIHKKKYNSETKLIKNRRNIRKKLKLKI